MTPNPLTSLCSLLALFAVDGALAGERETLVVGPGETLRLEAPEDGAGLEAALDGGLLKPAGKTLTAPAGGDHWLALASRDAAGNLSPIRWLRLRVDADPPDVVLNTDPVPVDRGRRWLPPGATVTASAEDDPAGVAELMLTIGDDVRQISGTSLSAALPSTGEVTARAWALDGVGNRSATASLTLAIDTTPPGGEIQAACSPASAAAGTVVAPDCRIDVAVVDRDSGGARWSLEIDGEAADAEALGGPWVPGPHTVEVTAIDAVGNQAVIGPFAFTVDGTGPRITWRVSSQGVEGADGETYHRPPVEVTAEAADPAGVARLTAATGGEAHRPIAAPVEVDGDSLLLRAVDGVGNVSQVQARWRLDLAPPVIRLETEDGQAISQGTTLQLERGDEIRFKATDGGSGLERATYSVAVESAHVLWRWLWWAPHQQPLPERLVFPWPGKISLSVEAIDRLGNRQVARWDIVVRPKRRGASS